MPKARGARSKLPRLKKARTRALATVARPARRARRKAPKPADQSRSFVVRSTRAMDPALHHLPPPSGQSLGNFTTVNSVVRLNVGTSTTLACMVMVCWTPSGLRAFKWTYNSGTGAVGNFSDGNRVVVRHLDTAFNAGPMSIRPLRLSCRVRNQTVFTSQAGIVQSLVVPDPVDWTGGFNTGSSDLQPTGTTTGQAGIIYDLMQQSPYTRTLTATDYQHTKSFIVPPVSEVAYHEWRNFVGVSSAEVTPWTNTQAAIIAGTDSNAMGVLLLCFQPSSVAQLYSLTIHTQDACRYSPIHLQSSFAAPQPHAPQDVVHAIHRAANTDPSLPSELVATALGLPAAMLSYAPARQALAGVANVARRAVPAIVDRAGQLALEDGYVALMA